MEQAAHEMQGQVFEGARSILKEADRGKTGYAPVPEELGESMHQSRIAQFRYCHYYADSIFRVSLDIPPLLAFDR